MNRTETCATVAQWANEVFGPQSDTARVAARANEEMAELLRAATSGKSADEICAEAADVVIVLARMTDLIGINLWDAVEAKMVINRARVWKQDGTGNGYHIREKSTTTESTAQ